MANDFVAAGYGTQGDISQAYADASAKREANRRANAASMAMGVMFLAALMGGGGGGQSDSGGGGLFSKKCPNCGRSFQPSVIMPSSYCDRCTSYH